MLKIPVGKKQKIYTQSKEVLPLLRVPPVSNSREAAAVKSQEWKFQQSGGLQQSFMD